MKISFFLTKSNVVRYDQIYYYGPIFLLKIRFGIYGTILDDTVISIKEKQFW